TAEGLSAIVTAHLGRSDVSIAGVAGWLALPEHDRWHLGVGREVGMLGVDTVLGSHVYHAALFFETNAGPLSYEVYAALLPHTRSLQLLREMVRLYIGERVDVRFCIELSQGAASPLELGNGTYLGLTSWLA